jgi:hypothetical protein
MRVARESRVPHYGPPRWRLALRIRGLPSIPWKTGKRGSPGNHGRLVRLPELNALSPCPRQRFHVTALALDEVAKQTIALTQIHEYVRTLFEASVSWFTFFLTLLLGAMGWSLKACLN